MERDITCGVHEGWGGGVNNLMIGGGLTIISLRILPLYSLDWWGW